ncbi:MAG: hypothetical protein ACJ77U_02155, partial [Chloroflexota bacterium]
MPVTPETHYLKTPDGVYLAYQVVGDGPVDISIAGGGTRHLEADPRRCRVHVDDLDDLRAGRRRPPAVAPLHAGCDGV